MKTFKYLLVCLVALCAFSCSEDQVLRTEGDDDPIIIPPPKPRPAPIPGDTIPV